MTHLKAFILSKNSQDKIKINFQQKNMAYFALRCFSPEVGKYVIIILNAIVAIMGITHWGIAGLYGTIKNYYDQTGIGDPSISIIYNGPIAYFSISGLVQVGVSAFSVAMLLGYVGNTNKIWWARALIILLVFEFAFNFYIAVFTSTMSSYYNSALRTYLNWTTDYLESLGDEKLRSFALSVKDFVRFCTAQAILTWLIIIPAIVILIVGLTDQLLNQNTVEEMGKLIAVPTGPGKAKNTTQVHSIDQNDTLQHGGSNNVIVSQKQ